MVPHKKDESSASELSGEEELPAEEAEAEAPKAAPARRKRWADR